jgi:hypothetical protein
MLNKLIVRVQQNQFSKTKTYWIKINGTPVGEINKSIPKSEFQLPLGNYLVEISSGDRVVTKKFLFTSNQFRILSIVPSLSRELIMGFTIGITTCFGLISTYALFTLSFTWKYFPVFFLTLVPIIVKGFKAKADFTISISV